mmetsp:Transcript_23644/g.45927  ORF Transcript_23644/g.45927 Transcript_23644/m.45927 type:complete len:249 (+) Transcript_23644:477-1223(+)
MVPRHSPPLDAVGEAAPFILPPGRVRRRAFGDGAGRGHGRGQHVFDDGGSLDDGRRRPLVGLEQPGRQRWAHVESGRRGRHGRHGGRRRRQGRWGAERQWGGRRVDGWADTADPRHSPGLLAFCLRPHGARRRGRHGGADARRQHVVAGLAHAGDDPLSPDAAARTLDVARGQLRHAWGGVPFGVPGRKPAPTRHLQHGGASPGERRSGARGRRPRCGRGALQLGAAAAVSAGVRVPRRRVQTSQIKA